jgi:hypothetical protein
LADAPIDVYALEYRLLPEDLSKVVLAGGMDVDEEGWHIVICTRRYGLYFIPVIAAKIGFLFYGINHDYLCNLFMDQVA